MRTTKINADSSLFIEILELLYLQVTLIHPDKGRT